MALSTKKVSKLQRREDLTGVLYAMPMIVKCIIFTVIPTIFCLIVSFTDYNMLASGNRITRFTLEHYIEVFTSEYYWRSMYNTIYYMIGLPIRLVLGFLLAVALNNKKLFGRTAFRVIYYLPAVSSVVAVSLVWRWIFNTDGVLNQILGTNISWLYDPAIVKNSLILKSIWGGIGGTMLMYLAGMQNINEELYEAADLDGASSFVKMMKITLPLCATMTGYLVLTGVTGALAAFSDNYTMIASESANTVVYWIYAQFKGGNYPLVAAGSFVLGVIIFVLSLPQFKRIVENN